MTGQIDHSGRAALSICEELLLAINDHNLLPESQIAGVLRDAAATHENAGGSKAEQENHATVARLINEIIISGSYSGRS